MTSLKNSPDLTWTHVNHDHFDVKTPQGDVDSPKNSDNLSPATTRHLNESLTRPVVYPPVLAPLTHSYVIDGDSIIEKYDNVGCSTSSLEDLVNGTLILTKYQILFVPDHQNDEMFDLFDKILKTDYSLPHSQILSFEEYIPQDIEKIKSYGSIRVYAKNNRWIQFYFFKDRVMKRVYQCMLKGCIFKCVSDTFAYSWFGHTKFDPVSIAAGWSVYNVADEFLKRQNIDLNRWTVNSVLNSNFKLCKTYPMTVVLPRVDEKIVRGSASYRSSNRLPVLTWANESSCLVRSSQPCTGITGTRSNHDELLLKAYQDRCKTKKLYIIDCRPKANALANLLVGKGYENTDNYPNSELIFMNIENIHVMSESFAKLSRLGLKSENYYLSSIEGTGWLKHISLILSGCWRMVSLLEEGNALLCHCSDGWDRTAQQCAITQLLMDPFYRTIHGFQVLIEKEWISFGHRFSDRYDHLKRKTEQMSPIFVQFMDAVYHIWQQYPKEFEFNERMLFMIVEQSYSCLFGNFLYNSEYSSLKHKKTYSTISLWTLINDAGNINYFKNPLYNSTLRIIHPDCGKLSTHVWSTFYLYPGMRSKYQEMTSMLLKSLEKENVEYKKKLDQEKLARKSLETELLSTRMKIEEYRMLLETIGDSIITEKIEDEFTLLTLMENEPKVKIDPNVDIIDDHFTMKNQ